MVMKNQSSGFIKVFRSMLSWEWYKDGNTFRVFMHLLLSANHKGVNWRGIHVGPGQVVTSYPMLSDELGISGCQARTAISHLKMTGEVSVKTANKYSLITIEKWASYQVADFNVTGKISGKMSRSGQPNVRQDDTKQEEKNEKKYSISTSDDINSKNLEEIINYGSGNNVRLTVEEFDRLAKEFPEDINDAIEYLSLYIIDKGDKSKASTHNATLRRWVINAVRDRKAKNPSSEHTLKKTNLHIVK